MKMTLVILLMLLTMSKGFAGDLPFPETEQEIVNALSLKDGSTTYQGVRYISKKGRVYKIINGKRYRVRGLAGIKESDIVPRTGAMIHFDIGSSEILLHSYQLLDEYGKALNNGLENAELLVEGHTDNQGAENYNQLLSEKRAQAVVDYLSSKHGILTSRLKIKAYGENKPISNNKTEKDRYRNRRVEFVRIN